MVITTNTNSVRGKSETGELGNIKVLSTTNSIYKQRANLRIARSEIAADTVRNKISALESLQPGQIIYGVRIFRCGTGNVLYVEFEIDKVPVVMCGSEIVVL